MLFTICSSGRTLSKRERRSSRSRTHSTFQIDISKAKCKVDWYENGRFSLDYKHNLGHKQRHFSTIFVGATARHRLSAARSAHRRRRAQKRGCRPRCKARREYERRRSQCARHTSARRRHCDREQSDARRDEACKLAASRRGAFFELLRIAV